MSDGVAEWNRKFDGPSICQARDWNLCLLLCLYVENVTLVWNMIKRVWNMWRSVLKEKLVLSCVKQWCFWCSVYVSYRLSYMVPKEDILVECIWSVLNFGRRFVLDEWQKLTREFIAKWDCLCLPVNVEMNGRSWRLGSDSTHVGKSASEETLS